MIADGRFDDGPRRLSPQAPFPERVNAARSPTEILDPTHLDRRCRERFASLRARDHTAFSLAFPRFRKTLTSSYASCHLVSMALQPCLLRGSVLSEAGPLGSWQGSRCLKDQTCRWACRDAHSSSAPTAIGAFSIDRSNPPI